MTPENYLLYSIKHKCYRDRSWIISVFAVTQETEAQKAKTYPGKFVREPFGFFMVDENNQRVQIETKLDKNEPLFRIADSITITPEWIDSLKETSLKTSIGILMVNLIALYEPFGSKFPYKNGRFKPSDIENIVAPKLESYVPGDQKKDGFFYVDELEKFAIAVTFLETLSNVFCHSLTERGMLPPPGRKEFREDALKRYAGKLHDPVEMAKFEAEMKSFDAAYMKGDPSYGKFMVDKVANARISAFMTQGGEANNFTGALELTPIIKPLEEGVATDPDGFVASANTIRYGSFARGAETVNGGVVAKAVMRASDSWRITEGDCGTKLGIKRIYTKKTIKHLVGRYLSLNGKAVLIETLEQAEAYIGKGNIVRSPQYCARPGGQTCQVCAGLALSKYPTGLTIPLTEVSGGILADSLKQMHNTKLETVTVDLSSVIT